MSSLVDRLERMTVTVASPDGNIKAKADSERRTRFWLSDRDAFAAYDAETLADQVAAVLRALGEGRRRGIRQAYESHGRTVADSSGPHWDARRRGYRAALAEMEVRGKSHNGFIRLKTSGMLDDYRVKIHPAAVERLNAESFLAELYSAYRSLRSDHTQRRAALKREHLPR
ncbi:MAG: hypothetical protein ACRDXX_17445 [Stackebrandtia sp.]